MFKPLSRQRSSASSTPSISATNMRSTFNCEAVYGRLLGDAPSSTPLSEPASTVGGGVKGRCDLRALAPVGRPYERRANGAVSASSSGSSPNMRRDDVGTAVSPARWRLGEWLPLLMMRMPLQHCLRC
eukprot:COSAG05_NODE_130_length_17165_cov_154.623638_25_plen_128_part_00